jgi:hypothetical protein
MGFLGLFEQPAKAPLKIPTGCFSLDADGRVISSTMPSSFPEEILTEIGNTVLLTIQEAHNAGLGLTEVSVHYASLRITARDLHGGALIFLNPLMMSTPDSPKS